MSMQVPIFGSGCWAADRPTDGDLAPAIAVSTTGVGEMLVKMQWASECAACLLQSEEHDTPIEAMRYAIEKRFIGEDISYLRFEKQFFLNSSSRFRITPLETAHRAQIGRRTCIALAWKPWGTRLRIPCAIIYLLVRWEQV